MLLQRSTLAAGNFKRPRLISPLILTVFAALVGVALMLMFPYQTLTDQVLRDRSGDALSITYLRNLLRTDPRNAELALRLGQQLFAAGHYSQLRATLENVLQHGTPADKLQARLLLWHAKENQWQQTPEDSEARESEKRALLEELRVLSAMEVDETTRLEIADRAYELGDQALGLKLYRSISSSHSHRPATWLIARAQRREQLGETDNAIQLYLLARSRSPSLDVQRECFFRAIRLVQAENRPRDALNLAEQELGPLISDQRTLVFMVELSRSANAPARAAHYARLMLRLSIGEMLNRFAISDGAHIVTVADAAPSGPPPGLPFDDHLYTLGYEAFVGNHNLEEAYRVAEFAVRQNPGNIAWRQRLAQVAEWSGRPEQALAQWYWLLTSSGTSGEARQQASASVLRLAPGLFDDKALQAGLLYELRHSPHSRPLLEALIRSYEHQGEPEQGIAVLQKIVSFQATPENMQALADLASRAGHVDLAIKTMASLVSRFGTDRERAFRLAALYLGQGQVAEAWDALAAAQQEVPADDEPFWRLLGSLSLRLQHDNEARSAYSNLVKSPAGTRDDFAALTELLALEAPSEAADLAQKGATRFNDWNLLLRSLELRMTAGPAETAWQTFRDLDPKWLERGENSPKFLAMRAEAARAVGKTAASTRDLTRLLELQPENASARQNLLWVMVDSHNQSALRNLLAANERQWAQDASLHDALAAAWQSLSAPQIALERYLEPRLKMHRHDFLWLMNYADVLEQNRQPDMAWQLRAYLMRTRQVRMSGPEDDSTMRQAARTRLAMSLQPGDRALSALRHFLSLEQNPDQETRTLMDEMKLSWMLAGEEPQSARQWLWDRYVRHLSNPDWARTALAMNAQDWGTLSAELDSRHSALMRDDAITVARAIHDNTLASSLGFNAQHLQRHDDTLQLQLSEVLLETAPRISIATERQKFGQWLENELRLVWQTQLTPGLRMSTDLTQIQRNVSTQTMTVPRTDTRFAFTLERQGAHANTRLTMAHHEALGNWTEAGLSQTYTIGKTQITPKIAWQETADESLALHALGMRDMTRLEGRHQLSPASSLNVAIQMARYRAQNGLLLGYGKRSEAELSHRLGAAGNDSQISVFWNSNDYRSGTFHPGSELDDLAARIPTGNSAAERVASLLPRDNILYGLRLGTGTSWEDTWTRKIRPYASGAITYNTDVGKGYSFNFGIAGSLDGADHLSAGFSTEQGTNSGTPRSTRINLRYWRAY